MKNKPENRNLQITRRAVCILAVCVTVVILGTAGLCLYFVYNKKPVWTQADLTVTQEVLRQSVLWLVSDLRLYADGRKSDSRTESGMECLGYKDFCGRCTE